MSSNPRDFASQAVHTSIVFLFLLSVVSFSANSGLQAQTTVTQETLTNADIIKLVQGHLRADVIVEQIRNNPGKYSLTTNSLLRLKQLGVPDNVIAAMQAKTQQRTVKGANEVRSAPPVWQIGIRHVAYKDGDEGFGSLAAAGEDRRVATLTLPVSHKGHVGTAKIEASCKDGNGNPNLWFRIHYTSQDGPTGFVLERPGQTIERKCVTGSVAGPVGLSMPIGGCGYVPVNHDAYVPLEISIDSRYVSTQSSVSDAEKVLFGFADNQSSAVGPLSMGYGARDIRVKLPLTDGETPTVDIHLQDPSFRQFVEGCDIPKPGNDTGSAPPVSETAKDLEDARNHMHLYQYDAAMTDYQAVLAVEPNNPEAKAAVPALQQVPQRRAAFMQGLEQQGVWYDPTTKLMWTMKDSDTELGFWMAEEAYCPGLKTAGLTGWNVPTPDQLTAIFDPGSANYHNRGKIQLRGQNGTVWATNRYGSYGFSFSTGKYRPINSHGYDEVRAICFRPLQPWDGVGKLF